jgi:hypothetical protein
MTRPAGALLGLLVAGAFYLLLIDTASPPELYAGAGATVLAAAIYELAREQGVAESALRVGWLARAWRLPWTVVVSIALVSAEAFAQLLFPRTPGRGSWRAVPFRAGGDNGRDAGRRALAEALGSLAPNTIVIGIDFERDLLLVHQLRRRGGREELDVLELG